MPTSRRRGKTPLRGVRVDNDVWQRFDIAVQALGVDRSMWLRDAILWCVREPGARAPKRPASNVDE